MKSLLLSLMLSLMMLSSIPSDSHAENWVDLGPTEVSNRYLDVDSIAYNETSGTLTVTLKQDFFIKTVEDYAIGFFEFNCSTKQGRILSVRLWKIDKTVEDVKVETTWHESGGSQVFHLLCDKKGM